MRINFLKKLNLPGFKNLEGLKATLLIVSFFYGSTTMAAAKIEQWATSQGAKVFYVHTQGLPLVDIQITFDAGSARDGEQHGVAALTADLLKSGAGQWNADQIAQRFENVGAEFGSSASIDLTSITLRSLTEPALLNPALETLQTVLTQPTFAENDFQREKNQALAAIKKQEESPAELADLAFDKAVFGSHPYAYSTLGYLETVSKLKTQDLKQFYQRYYVAANAMIVIVGDVNKQQAEQTAEKLFKNLPAGKKPEPLPEVKLPEKPTVQNLDFPSSQTHILVGMPGMSRTDADYFSLYVGNYVLGGSGLVSKLFKEVREKRGLAYSAYSYNTAMVKLGRFTAGLETKNAQTSQALKVLNDTINDFVNNGITEKELESAKKNITGGFALRVDTNKKLAGYVTTIGFFGLPLDYLDTFTQKIDALTIEQIKDAFKRRVKPELFQTVTVGGKQ